MGTPIVVANPSSRPIFFKIPLEIASGFLSRSRLSLVTITIRLPSSCSFISTLGTLENIIFQSLGPPPKDVLARHPSKSKAAICAEGFCSKWDHTRRLSPTTVQPCGSATPRSFCGAPSAFAFVSTSSGWVGWLAPGVAAPNGSALLGCLVTAASSSGRFDMRSEEALPLRSGPGARACSASKARAARERIGAEARPTGGRRQWRAPASHSA
eukprot:scaffold59969_cov31-Tisochrysis_lutea.AAC.3